jgi:hypothetical protein
MLKIAVAHAGGFPEASTILRLVCLRHHYTTTNNSENLMREIYWHKLLCHAYSNVTKTTFCSDS